MAYNYKKKILNNMKKNILPKTWPEDKTLFYFYFVQFNFWGYHLYFCFYFCGHQLYFYFYFVQFNFWGHHFYFYFYFVQFNFWGHHLYFYFCIVKFHCARDNHKAIIRLISLLSKHVSSLTIHDIKKSS